MQKRFTSSYILATLVIILCCAVASAQEEKIGTKTGNKEGPPKNPPSNKVVYREKVIRVTPTTGSLTIVARPGAVVTMERLSAAGKPVKTIDSIKVADGERSVINNDLAPGRYRLTAELDGFKSAVGEKQVKANVSDKIELNLEAITYNVSVKINTPSGTLTYARGQEVPRSVNFVNGIAQLSGLTEGQYNIKLIPDDASYKELDTVAKVPLTGNELSFSLEKFESRDFTGALASSWNLPDGWSTIAGGRIIKIVGAGIALPKDTNSRNYKDFQMTTDAKMVNGVSVSFALRMEDPRNYYLIQITGSKSDEPYVLRGWVVRDGTPRRMGRTFPISQFADSIKPGKYFNVAIKMAGGDVNVKIRDSETGDLLPLGTLPDPSNTFKIGAVGLAGAAGEDNEISQFSICTANCPNP